MLEVGEQLDWNESLVADKHCIGGIPGNRTSMLVVPIIAAHGMLIPKTSSRAITSPADDIMIAVERPLGIYSVKETIRRVDSFTHRYSCRSYRKGASNASGAAPA